MSDKPILFSGPMVRAILEGRKTQTRRVVKPPPLTWNWKEMGERDWKLVMTTCPYGQPGDRLWVRETWAHERQFDHLAPSAIPITAQTSKRVKYAPLTNWWDKTRTSIHMPRWACRLTLEIVRVRVERVQDITPADCRAEGMPAKNNDVGVRYCYGQLWNQLNEARGFGWDKNPWIWVIEFKLISHPGENAGETKS